MWVSVVIISIDRPSRAKFTRRYSARAASFYSDLHVQSQKVHLSDLFWVLEDTPIFFPLSSFWRIKAAQKRRSLDFALSLSKRRIIFLLEDKRCPKKRSLDFALSLTKNGNIFLPEDKRCPKRRSWDFALFLSKKELSSVWRVIAAQFQAF